MDIDKQPTLAEQVEHLERIAFRTSIAFNEMYSAVETLIHNVKQRHPGQALYCPDMMRLDALLEKYNPNNGG